MAPVDGPSTFYQHGPPPPSIDFLPDSSSPDNRNEDRDIYRGEPPSPPRTPRPESVSSSSSSSSSTTSSFVFGGRLGAISALVEHALSHWARAWASTSSLETSSSSSSLSNSINTKSRTRRRRPRSSLADLHNAKSEREVAARIRAREEARQVPREFVLYTPPPSNADQLATQFNPSRSHRITGHHEGVLRTSSLPLIITRLSMSLRVNIKIRRAQESSHAPPLPRHADTAPVLQLQHHDYMIPEELIARNTSSPEPLEGRAHRRIRKGKQRAGRLVRSTSVPRIPTFPSERELDRAWWLDVSSPTWEDLHAIGKLLHLHPLTLEDILQQDPREKLELFPGLGYYFVSFRAIESQKTRERRRSSSGGLQDEGIVGVVNVYLVVFREGICSFHFSDISEHTDAVRNRLLMGDEVVTVSSDWIAHGIMDSIVDSFFPFAEEIDKEVSDIESLIFSAGEAVISSNKLYSAEDSSGSSTVVSHDEKSPEKAKESHAVSLTMKDEDTCHSIGAKTHFVLPKRHKWSFRHLRNDIRSLMTMLRVDVRFKSSSGFKMTAATVHRIARIRRLVTSLARLLATKSEVVAQVKKRILARGEFGLDTGTGDDKDVFVYMGDIQDHILTLQQSLAHYERMLSQSYPTYLNQLRLSVSKAKSGTDKAIVWLTAVSMGVLCLQTLIGLNSMNINIPHNDRAGNRYWAFGIVISLAFVILVIYGSLVYWWWVQAKKKRGHW